MLSRGVFGARSVALCAAAALTTLTACSTPSTYAGIDLTAGGADPKLQALASRARAGSKHAQLELGIRYEEGEGVPVDLELARELYEEAAERTLKRQTVYVPDGGAVRADTTFVGTRSGLKEARTRAARLSERAPELGASKPVPSESPAEIKTHPRLAGGPGIRALRQLIKVEYFSDACLYNAIGEARAEREAQRNSGSRATDKFLDRLSISQRCLSKLSLPENCREYQEEIVKVMLSATSEPRFAMFGRLVPNLRPCISKKWIDQEWGAGRRNQRLTPLEYILQRNTSASADDFSSKAASAHDDASDDPVIDRVLTGNLASQYWELRCDLANSQAYRSAFEEVDLVVCSGPNERRASVQAGNLLESLGVEYAR